MKAAEAEEAAKKKAEELAQAAKKKVEEASEGAKKKAEEFAEAAQKQVEELAQAAKLTEQDLRALADKLAQEGIVQAANQVIADNTNKKLPLLARAEEVLEDAIRVIEKGDSPSTQVPAPGSLPFAG